MLEHRKQAFWLCWRAYEMVSRRRPYGSRLVNLNRIFNAIRCIRDTPCMTDHCREICPDQVGQRVDPVLHSFSASQKRNRNLLHCEEQTVGAVPLWLQGPFHDPHQPLETARERRGFVEEKATNDASVCLAAIYSLLVLLLSNLLRFRRDFCCSPRSSVRKHRHANGRTSGNSTDNYRCPVGQVPPIHCERAYRHRTSPLSMLEPILP